MPAVVRRVARRRCLLLRAGLFTLLCVGAGCGGTGASSAVSGRVVLEGAPLEDGSILFVPVDGTPGGAAGGPITAGAYQVPRGLVPGVYRVEVRRPRPSRRRIPKPFGAPGETIAGMEESLATECNDRSALQAALTAGANVADFDVRPRPSAAANR